MYDVIGLNSELEGLVNSYFQNIVALRSGDATAVGALMDMWDFNGTFEFAGASPVIGTYRGRVAIQTLYQNRLAANGMALTLEGNEGEARTATLGLVATNVTHLRLNGTRAVAGWRTTIGTEEGDGFDVAGSHLFDVADGKIVNLRVTISPKADPSEVSDLSLENLSVSDVGRLSLAAWPVV